MKIPSHPRKDGHPFNTLTTAKRCCYMNWVCMHLSKMLPKKSGQRLLSKDTTLKYDLTSSKKISILFTVFLQKDRTEFNKLVSFKYTQNTHLHLPKDIRKEGYSFKDITFLIQI